jgi:hypothetical protein
MKLVILLVFALLLVIQTPTAQAQITADIQPSRISGVAPLAVHFDATGTTHTDTTINEFHDLQYEWTFGDPNAGHWQYGARAGSSSPHPRNEECCSAIAAHVYDNPGTYTVNLIVKDSQGNISTDQVAIEVEDPDEVFSGTTACISSSGNFAGCPSSNTSDHFNSSDFDSTLS